VRFLLSRRWVLFALAVVVLAISCYLLGRWQFHRLHDREATNAQTRTNLAASRAPVDEVLGRGRPVPPRDEWRRVTASGTYDGASSVSRSGPGSHSRPSGGMQYEQRRLHRSVSETRRSVATRP